MSTDQIPLILMLSAAGTLLANGILWLHRFLRPQSPFRSLLRKYDIDDQFFLLFHTIATILFLFTLFDAVEKLIQVNILLKTIMLALQFLTLLYLVMSIGVRISSHKSKTQLDD